MAKSRGEGTRFVDALPEEGERRLMLAVLIDAIRGLTALQPKSPHVRVQRAWVRDRAWILSDDKSTPFSFANICDSLGIDAGYVRRCVLRPLHAQQPIRVRRYPERVRDSWVRLQRNSGRSGLRPIPRTSHNGRKIFQGDAMLKEGVG